MDALISTGAVVMLGGLLVLSAAFSDGRTSSHACMTKQDISSHQERSRTGISSTCTHDIMLQNLRGQVSR